MKLKLLLFALLLHNISQAQEIKRLIFGVNVGVKFANKNYAVRYTGFYQNQLKNFFNIQNNYQTVRTLLGNKDFVFDSYSDLYRFQPAPVYGINFGFQASENLSFETDLNFSNIKMLGGYTLAVTDPGNFTSQAIYANGNISGQESRFNGRINMNYRTDGDKIKGVFGLSGLLNSWRMEENIVELNGSILTSLYSQFNPSNGFTTRVQGSGFGYGINLGVEVPFKKGIVMQIVYQPYVTRMDYFNTKQTIDDLGDDYQRPDMRLEHDLIARFVWR
jgi:hypothetical protein